MAGRDQTFTQHLRADDQLTPTLEKAADAVDELESTGTVKVRVDADVSRALDQLELIDQDARAAAVAAEALGDALGPELSARSDLPTLVDELKRLGLTAEQVTANAKELGAQLQTMDSPDLGGKFGQAMGTARGETEKLTDSARGANSALANMIGNSAQDLGALSGVAGSAGVALGQMAEYAADATLGSQSLGESLGSMARVVGPIAALSAAVAIVSAVMGDQQKQAQQSAERTAAFGDAMGSATDDAQGLADVLRDVAQQDQLRDFAAASNDALGDFGIAVDRVAERVPLIGGFFERESTDIIAAMGKAGLSMYDFSSAITNTFSGMATFRAQLQAAKNAGQITGEEFNAMAEAAEEYAANARKAAEAQRLWNVDADEANAILGDLTAQADPLSQMTDQWATLFADMADGTITTQAAADAINQLRDGLGMTSEQVVDLARQHLADDMEANAEATQQAADAAREYAQVLASDEWGASTITAAADAFGQLAESTFGLQNIAANSQAAYDELNASVKENGFTFDIATEKGRANAEQIQNLYQSLIPQLSAAFADAGGSVDSFAANMDTLRTGVFQQLDQQTNLTTDQINAVIDQLGVFDGSTYASTFELLGTEDATTKLGLLSGVLGSLPEDVQRQVTLAVIAGDPQAALDAVQASVSGSPPPTADLALDTKPAEADAKGFTQQDRAVKPVTVDANTGLAAAALLAFLSLPRATTIYVGTSGVPEVSATLNALDDPRRAPIDAYLRDWPTAAEIAARIGVVRVPIDTYVRNEARVTGVRD